MKEPFIAKKIQRMIESAIDNCVQEIVEKQDAFIKSLSTIQDLDLNQFKKDRRMIEENVKDIEYLQELYVMLFEKEYAIDELLTFKDAIELATTEPLDS